MPIPQDELHHMLESAFPDAEIRLKSLVGDNDHYEATIQSRAFNGKSKVQQHQMVYAALKGKMGGELHALSLKTIAQTE